MFGTRFDRVKKEDHRQNYPIYHKIPVISPGLIQLRKGFCVGLLAEGLIFGRAYKRNKKKNVSKRATGVLIEIRF